jgi:HSP20 family protein
MAKLHWIPWMALSDLGRESDRLTGEAVATRGECGYAWSPAADVVETDREFHVTLELAGVSREAVTVAIQGRYLVVQGERRPCGEPGGVYQIMERSYGPFLRRFALPLGVIRHEITAVMKDGLLCVTMRKASPERLRRRIPID